MRSCLAVIFSLALLASAHAGEREDAFSAVLKFKKGFDTGNTALIVQAFAPNAIFLGTRMPKPGIGEAAIKKYFANSAASMPKSVEIEHYEAVQASPIVYVFSGQNTFHLTRNGNKVSNPARFTFVVGKSKNGWKIIHFHSSGRPKPPRQ